MFRIKVLRSKRAPTSDNLILFLFSAVKQVNTAWLSVFDVSELRGIEVL